MITSGTCARIASTAASEAAKAFCVGFGEYHKVAACNCFRSAKAIFNDEVAFHYWDFPAFASANHGFLLETIAEVAEAAADEQDTFA